MILLTAPLLAGSLLLVPADLPTPDPGTCVIMDVMVTAPDPTIVDPDPATTAMQLVERCGFTAYSDTGASRTERQTMIVDVTRAQAEVILSAASDLTADTGVFVISTDVSTQ